jgi:hypothetical protein
MVGAPSHTGLSARMAGLRVAPPASARSAVPAGRAATVSVVARSGRPGVGVLGKKAGMTQIFTDDGLAVPATVISVADGNVVTAVRTTETSGYNAVQVGYAVVPERKLTKPEAGHLKAAGTPLMRHLVEFKVRAWGGGGGRREKRGRRRRGACVWPAAGRSLAAGGGGAGKGAGIEGGGPAHSRQPPPQRVRAVHGHGRGWRPRGAEAGQAAHGTGERMRGEGGAVGGAPRPPAPKTDHLTPRPFALSHLSPFPTPALSSPTPDPLHRGL